MKKKMRNITVDDQLYLYRVLKDDWAEDNIPIIEIYKDGYKNGLLTICFDNPDKTLYRINPFRSNICIEHEGERLRINIYNPLFVRKYICYAIDKGWDALKKQSIDISEVFRDLHYVLINPLTEEAHD